MAYTADWESGNHDERLKSRDSALLELYPKPSNQVDLAAAYAFPDIDAPWVRANFVSSVDGAATLGGRSGGLGNDTDRRIFALLRALADVVLVGAGTARAESYGPAEIAPEWRALRTARAPTPPIAVVSHRLDLDLSAPLFTAAPPHARTILLTDSTARAQRRRAAAKVADVIVTGDREVDPAVAIDALAQQGYRRISCEGGPRLLAGLAASGMLDELCLTHSPMLVSGVAPRITNGLALPVPLDLRVEHLLADGNYLFSRYALSNRAPDETPDTNALGDTR